MKSVQSISWPHRAPSWTIVWHIDSDASDAIIYNVQTNQKKIIFKLNGLFWWCKCIKWNTITYDRIWIWTHSVNHTWLCLIMKLIKFSVLNSLRRIQFSVISVRIKCADKGSRDWLKNELTKWKIQITIGMELGKCLLEMRFFFVLLCSVNP